MNKHDSGRRGFLKAATAAGAAGAWGVAHPAPAGAGQPTGGLPITVAGYRNERVAALADGRAGFEGCRVTFEPDKIGNLNTHIFEGPATRQVTEVGLHPFMLAYAKADFRSYTLLPVFPLRTFRHKSVFIRTDRGIEKPEDLRGRKVGTPGYSSTSLTWIRGLLEGEYGVKPTDVEWVVSSGDSSAKDTGGASRFENTIPEGLSVSQGPEGLDESDLLAEGHVAALFHAAKPRAFVEGHPDVARLFPDSRAVERDYYSRTGIFPIMHAVAIRRDVVGEHPGLVRVVFDGYSKAKQLTYAQLAGVRSLLDTLPWYGQELEETRALMGDNFYSYGMGPNRKTLETFFRYSHQQGFTDRELKIEELFEPASLGVAEAL